MAVLRALRVNGGPPSPVEEARLSFVSDDKPGFTRRRRGSGFEYLDTEGKPIRDARLLERIGGLVIPPAWSEVWVCPSARGHIQATGRDARGRKQYIYHPEWVALRDLNKFGEMIRFAEALPALRRRVARELRGRGLGRNRVLAAVVQLLDRTLIRVGNEKNAEANGTFGLTTLRSRHLRASGSTLRFEFPGKNGIPHKVTVDDRRLASVVRRCQELPGQDLFQCVDDDGARRSITSGDVNDYLREITGCDFTAKDFRTWAATVRAACELHLIGCSDTATGTRRNLTAAVRKVAAMLRNTAAVCRKSYIHPLVLDSYADGRLADAMTGIVQVGGRSQSGLSVSERAVLRFLKRCAAPKRVAKQRPRRHAPAAAELRPAA
jgi:DNA topoisomerase-1